jgi:hypothetical protein
MAYASKAATTEHECLEYCFWDGNPSGETLTECEKHRQIEKDQASRVKKRDASSSRIVQSEVGR